MENTLIYWDEKGNPLLSLVVHDDDFNVRELDECFSKHLIAFFKEKAMGYDTSSEHVGKLELEP